MSRLLKKLIHNYNFEKSMGFMFVEDIYQTLHCVKRKGGIKRLHTITMSGT